jgi:cell division protein FtsQ
MWDDPKQLNAFASVLALVAAGLLLWGALAWTVRQPPFAFREIVVRGPLGHVSATHLEAVVRNELAGTFFTMNLEGARAALARIPWVRSVALRRQWPQRLEMTIDEHAPLARWNATELVNTQGEVFFADYHGALPQFEGSAGRAAEVAARYRDWSEALAPLALTVASVRLSSRGGWRVEANGADRKLAIELGREEPTARLVRFVSAYERTVGTLARSGTRIEQVDLRYRNGFAARVPGFRERTPKRDSGAPKRW